MTEYVHVGSHALALANGRHIGPGDRVTDRDLDLKAKDGEDHVPQDAVFVDEGHLVDVASFGEPGNQLTRTALLARAADLQIDGRSKMSTDELQRAVIAAEADQGGQHAA